MTTAATSTPSVITGLQTIFGSTFNRIASIGTGAIHTGSVMTDGNLFGVPFLTISTIAITSMVMAYVTLGDGSEPEVESEPEESMFKLNTAPPSAFSGGKRRSRKSRSKKGRKTSRR